MTFAPSRQLATPKIVKIHTLMSSADFVAGFNEVRKGKGLPPVAGGDVIFDPNKAQAAPQPEGATP